MKVSSETQTLIQGACPSCWRQEGQDHDPECLSAKLIQERGPIKVSGRDPFENDSEWLKEKVDYYRQSQKTIFKEDPVEFVNPPRRMKPVPFETFLNDLHKAVWERWEKGTVSVYNEDGTRLAWDVPAGQIPLQGTIIFRVCRRSGHKREMVATLLAHTFNRGLDTWAFQEVG